LTNSNNANHDYENWVKTDDSISQGDNSEIWKKNFWEGDFFYNDRFCKEKSEINSYVKIRGVSKFQFFKGKMKFVKNFKIYHHVEEINCLWPCKNEVLQPKIQMLFSMFISLILLKNYIFNFSLFLNLVR